MCDSNTVLVCIHIIPVPTQHLFDICAEDNPQWQKYFTGNIKNWHSAVINVVLGGRCGRPVLVVRYEDVKNNRTAEVLYMYVLYTHTH